LLFGIGSCGGKGPAKAINLHNVDWANVTIPGSVCGAKDPIQLRKRKAVVSSSRWGSRLPRVTVSSGWNPVVYGDLDRDGKDEAALVVDCNNGGGTADGVLAYAQIVFTAGEKSPRPIGIITPRQHPPHELPTLLRVSIQPGAVVAHEAWYRPTDGTCCPSGRSTTVWRLRGGRLQEVNIFIVTRASLSLGGGG